MLRPQLEHLPLRVAARERGQAMLIVVLMVGVGVSALVYGFASPAGPAIERDRKTAAALALARDALIGRAAADQARPGSLPCPDTDNDGVAESPVAFGGVCPAYIGRFPWKTLGLPDTVDGDGEHLWYALTPAFRDHPSGGVLNSDTAGQLTINDTSGTVISSQVIAVIFAPGAVVPGQARGTVAEQTTVANYLEGANSDGDTVYASGLATDTFNDKLLALTSDALFNVVNVRVAKEAITALESYYTTNGYYPFANAYGSAAPYDCTGGLTRGRFPITPTGCGQAVWAALPAWFSTNNWNLVTHYAISKSCGELSGALSALGIGTLLCGLATNIPLLTSPPLSLVLALFGLSFTDDPISVTGVTGANGARTLVIITGQAMSGQVHTCASAGQCMDDPENTDGNAVYAKPSRFPASNDRMALKCDGTTCATIP